MAQIRKLHVILEDRQVLPGIIHAESRSYHAGDWFLKVTLHPVQR